MFRFISYSVLITKRIALAASHRSLLIEEVLLSPAQLRLLYHLVILFDLPDGFLRTALLWPVQI
jgi:hypothetical protein